MEYPDELKYTSSDEWVGVTGEEAAIGISDYAQDQLSDIVYLELVVEEGAAVSQGEAIATVESVKAAADIYAPVSGTVTAVNDDLADAPELLNTDPYGAGWLVKLELSARAELDALLDSAAYAQNVQEREG